MRSEDLSSKEEGWTCRIIQGTSKKKNWSGQHEEEEVRRYGDSQHEEEEVRKYGDSLQEEEEG